MVEEEDKEGQLTVVNDNRDEIEHLSRKTLFLQEKLGREEDTKRRTLLRYVHAVKAAASPQDMSMTGTGGGSEQVRVGSLQLPESGIGNEEVHAIAALLRGNSTITELNLRGNAVTDEGARAMAAVLSGRSRLRHIDLRGNQIGKGGVRAMAEALERSERVRHVYVHAGGKVEALGTGAWAQPGDDSAGGGAASMVTVETVCVVDARDNVCEIEPEFATPVGGSTIQNGSSKSKMGSSSSAMMLGNGGGGGTVKKSSKMDMRKSQERKRERLKRQQKRQHDNATSQKNKELEANWAGRAGGYEGAPSDKSAGNTSSLPPLGKSESSKTIARSTSAPGGLVAAKSKGNSTPYTRRLMESPLAAQMSKK